MFARLWWKEARQAWPAWGFLAAAGIAAQSYLFCYWKDEASPGGYAYVALVITMMYPFLIAAAAFAGERESGTLWILDAMPAGRLRLWSAKASFALATTLALGILLWLGALAFGRDSSEWRAAGAAALVWGLTALGWGLLWSALLPNALHAALLAIASLCLTLLLLVDLQYGQVLEAAPTLLGLAALTTGASAWAFKASGPPGRGPRRSRPAAPLAIANVSISGDAEAARRPCRIWAATVPRLLWETLRQVRAELWMLVAVAVAGATAPYLIAWNLRSSNDAISFTFVAAMILALATGVLAFNGENRGRTHRFLLHHGAQAGVVWAVKVATWWGIALGLWAVAFAPAWLTLPPAPTRELPGGIGLGSVVSWVVVGLTIPFAIALLCGMAFRRGIMAGMVALIATLAVIIPMLAGLAAQVVFPWHWPYVAIGLLAASWAWSGDWLRDAPGWGRWARLALCAAAAPAILAPLYIADRARGVRELPPHQVEAFFQRSRVVAPVPEGDNAAPLYREAYRLISRNAYPAPEPNAERAPAWVSDVRFLDQQSFDPPSPRVTAWLEQVEPALAKLREGARKPACRYMDLRTATEFDRFDEPPIHGLILPLAVSARVRLVRGDLDGSWAEIESLARLARQYSYTSPWATQINAPLADSLALRWAADPRQTASSLEKAARAWEEIPPGASPAERIRIDAALFHNMIGLPREELIDKLLYGQADLKRKVTVEEKLRNDVVTTPWEVARARRAFNLLAAAQVQRLESDPSPFAPDQKGASAEQARGFNWMVDPHWNFLISESNRTVALTPEELNTLVFTTPLLRYTPIGQNSALLGRGLAMRRIIRLVLLLRLHQARHDGKLPTSLNEILARPREAGDLAVTPEDLIDPYSGGPFGYVASHGQMLLPIGAAGGMLSASAGKSDSRLEPAEGCQLLYSVGPDGVDDRAERNAGFDQRSDLVFPLKDGVRPPGSESR